MQTKSRRKAKLPFSLRARAGVWHYSKMLKGHRVEQSLHTDDRALAEAAGRRLYEQQLAANFSAFRDLSGRGWSTAAELKAAYFACEDIKANPKVRRRNFGDLDNAVRLVRGCGSLEWTTGDLTADLVARWKRAWMERARKRCGDDGLALEAAQRGLNSTLRHWKSVICGPAVKHYRITGIVLPDHIGELATEKGVPAEKVPDVVPLSVAELAALDAAAPGLRATDPATWCVYQLMAYGGLRNRECMFATWDWIGRRGDEWFIDIKRRADYKPKGESGRAGLSPELVAALLDCKREGDDHIVPADTPTARLDACYRRINSWLEAVGIRRSTGGKRAYRLRRQVAYTVEIERGAEAAARAIRHSGKSDLLRHYSPAGASISAPLRTLRGSDELAGAEAIKGLRPAAG